MLLSIAAPANNERGPRYMEKALAAIHQALPRRTQFCFEYGVSQGLVGLFVRLPQAIEPLVRGPLQANYPNCSIMMCDRDESIPPEWEEYAVDLFLSPELFPILRHSQFEDLLNGNFADPTNAILQAITPDDSSRCRIVVTISAASHRRKHWAYRAIRRLDSEFFRKHHRLAAFYARHITRPRVWLLAWFLGCFAAESHTGHRSPVDSSASRMHDREDDLQAAADKVGGHLFEVTLSLQVSVPTQARETAEERLRQMTGALGAFTRSRLATFEVSPVTHGPRRRAARFLMSHEELATLWHPPTSTVIAEKMANRQFCEREAPPDLPSGIEPGAVVLGQTLFRQDERVFGVSLEDRRRHVYLIGKTGMGKSTLLQNMIVSDMQQGLGVCLVDPHGDLADSLLGLVPSFRTNDVIYFDAADREHAVPFNPLACRDRRHLDQVTSGVVSAFKKLHDSWGPRLEDTLRNSVFAIVEQQGNLLSLVQLLGDSQYREQLVPRIEDDIVRGFWQHEFARWSIAYRTEAVAAIQNKIRPFLTNTNMRAIVTHKSKSLDLREVMDAGGILIVNLSKGRIGEDNSALLGAFLVTSLQQAAMTRADIPEAERRDFFLYADEFQNFTTGSFATLLSEARKYHVGIVVAHQYLSQLSEETARSIWGNVGSMLAFQVGSDDAEVLAQQFGRFRGELQPQDFTSLPKHTAYARLLVQGLPTKAFSMHTSWPSPVNSERADIVKRHSQRRFVRDATLVA